jgi:hypothetical protein
MRQERVDALALTVCDGVLIREHSLTSERTIVANEYLDARVSDCIGSQPNAQVGLLVNHDCVIACVSATARRADQRVERPG